ncbi:MAG: carboxypeptidase-like regulatory domain-containing protein [Planctomycetaceae bacterium]|jgi:hypothetical protein|nr:carboxypeptidase-like regulatory domain-containing protein [Planctomycetaceae bacterium]
MLKNLSGFILCLMVLMLFAGCSPKKKPDGLPKLYPLTIKITQDGNTPLANASVRLISTDQSGTTRWNVNGTTNTSGVTKLKTYGEYDGAPAGNYKVVVSKEEIVYDTSTPPQITGRFQLVERKYSSIQETPLMVDVNQDTEEITFDVGKSVREKMEVPK